MIIQQKSISPISRSYNNSDIKIKEFITTINSLNFSIKEVYKDFLKNLEKEYDLINLIESNIGKYNVSLIEVINYLRIYIDLDKNSLDDFFEKAKIIFKDLKIIFNSLKQLINPNHQYRYTYNIFPQPKISDNLQRNTLKNKSMVNLRQKSRTPIKERTQKNSSSFISQNSFKQIKFEISKKDKEIKDLSQKLKILEQNNTELYKNFKLISEQKIESDEKLKELKKKHEELQIKYNKLEQNIYDFKSDEKNNSSYDEGEFDLKKIAKGIKNKNFSQDMNIDNPGLSSMKEKNRELVDKYNTLFGLVKNLLPTINKNNRNECIINDIIKIIFGKGFKK